MASLAASSPSACPSASCSSGSNAPFHSSTASLASDVSLPVLASLPSFVLLSVPSSFSIPSSVATIPLSKKLSALESIDRDGFNTISSFLNSQDIGSMSLVSKSIRQDIILSFIQNARKVFKDILALAPLDHNRLNDSRYLSLYKRHILQKIRAVPEFLEIFRQNNEDCEKTAQEIKDRDLLKACAKILPQQDVIATINEEPSTNNTKALRARAWLAVHANDELFNRNDLYLAICHLKTVPMELLLRFHNLQRLILAGNQIQVIPDAIGNLGQLQNLHLCSNQIHLIPDAIGNLAQLQNLYLGSNQIRVIPDVIGNLGQMQNLYLAGNQIRVIPDAIGNLGQMQNLHLCSNQIRVIPDAIGNLGQMQRLNLDGNQIEIIPDAIRNLGQLHYLYLDSNQIRFIPDAIGRLGQLQNLFLSDNQIRAIPDAIGRLGQMQWLDLSRNRIRIIPDTIRNIPHLHLDNNPIEILQLQEPVLNHKPICPRIKSFISCHKGSIAAASAAIVAAIAFRYLRSYFGLIY
jgi:Leucine-rich repeat (LRR) protein